MVSKIAYIQREDQRLRITFKLDDQIILLIENCIKEINPGFKLAEHSKKHASTLVKSFWSLNDKVEGFYFELLVREEMVRLRLACKKKLINIFLKNLYKHADFIAPKRKVAKR